MSWLSSRNMSPLMVKWLDSSNLMSQEHKMARHSAEKSFLGDTSLEMEALSQLLHPEQLLTIMISSTSH